MLQNYELKEIFHCLHPNWKGAHERHHCDSSISNVLSECYFALYFSALHDIGHMEIPFDRNNELMVRWKLEQNLQESKICKSFKSLQSFNGRVGPMFLFFCELDSSNDKKLSSLTGNLFYITSLHYEGYSFSNLVRLLHWSAILYVCVDIWNQEKFADWKSQILAQLSLL
jgi:hypothetical protein